MEKSHLAIEPRAPSYKPLKFSTLSLNISKILPFPLFYTIGKWTYLFSSTSDTLSSLNKLFIYNTYFNVLWIYQLSFLLSSNFSLYVHRSVYNCRHQKSRSYHRKNPTASAFLNIMLFFSLPSKLHYQLVIPQCLHDIFSFLWSTGFYHRIIFL